MIDFKIILNVCLGMILYKAFVSLIGKALLTYFLDNSKTVQKEKETFHEKLRNKLEEQGK